MARPLSAQSRRQYQTVLDQQWRELSPQIKRARLLRAARFKAAQLGPLLPPGAHDALAKLTTNQLKNALAAMNSLGG